MSDWHELCGDADPGRHGGTFYRDDGEGRIEVWEIQPVRDHCSDDEAAEVGFPFWTRESFFYPEDLRNPPRRVLVYCDVWDPTNRLEVAYAMHAYGLGASEGAAGWADDVAPDGLPEGVIESMRDEDEEFRREILGEVSDDE